MDPERAVKREEEKLREQLDSDIYDIEEQIILERDNPELQEEYKEILRSLKAQRVTLVRNGLTKIRQVRKEQENKSVSKGEIVQINEVN